MIFRNWVLQNFPFLEDDFDALTDYELFCKMVEYMKKSLDKVKEYQDELNEFRTELDTYKNYFDNLDVQEEINNKLDEMAESGQLTDIIAQYLGLAGVLAFNTVSDMVAGENLVNGSICKTLGELSYNDGYGAFYKVRTITNDDIIDGTNIISLNISDTLIAELITNSNNGIIQDEINEIKSRKKMVVIGDSYSSSSQSGTPLWYTYISKWHNLDVYTNAGDGQGYGTGTNNFLIQLQTAYNNNEPDDIKEIYIVGGINDVRSNMSEADFATYAQTVLSYATEHFPNSKIYVVGILPFQYYNFGGGNDYLSPYNRAWLFQSQLSYRTLSYDNIIFRNAEYLGLMIADYFTTPNDNNQCHPTAKGQKVIANFIENGETKYGFTDGDTNTTIKTMPLSCDNGTLSINRMDGNSIGFNITSYVSTNALNISMKGLCYLNTYIMITDEKGHTSALYSSVYDGNLKLPANAGLESGTLYFTIPWKMM